jgi:S1-C subfamily serine protease
VFARFAAVAQDVGVVAAGVFEGVGEDRQAVECPFVVDRPCDLDHRAVIPIQPSWVHGEDLTPQEKKALGLGEKRLALRQGNFVTPPARQAGIRQNDVILGVDGKELEMTGRQFAVYVKLNYKVGDKVTYNLLRDGKRLDVELTLTGRQ